MKLLKRQINELVEENRVLHEELRRSVVTEIVGTGIIVPGVCLIKLIFNSPHSVSNILEIRFIIIIQLLIVNTSLVLSNTCLHVLIVLP